MSLWLIVFWIIGVTSFTLLGSLYARRFERPDLLIGLYVAFILTAQMLATKIAIFDLGFASYSGPAGVLVFAVTFLLTDIVNEKFGRKITHRMILIAFCAMVAMSFFLWLGTQFTADPFWASQNDAAAWDAFFGMIPRITIASWVAFLISENADAVVYDLFKKVTKGKHLWLRNVVSTIPALALDSLIFVPLAFYGIPGFPIFAAIKGQIIMKWIVGMISVPFMYLNYYVLTHRKEGPDRVVWGETKPE